jgi:predicted DNA-binding mobile mystery protein A
MTTAQLGKRMGLTQPRAVQIEKAERDGNISLASLERAAQALGCRIVYWLVPHESFKAQVENRARALATKRLGTISHNDEDEQEQLEQTIEELLNAPGSKLWDEP